ncbi:hypothetical protein DNTS_033825 [Danionella cerebrum]|uniref:PDZ domain-containing protein n=1 Tax=Danionella cerebrum TaxID=2873325 RepID=A0A553R5H5_9TELE|nr:hypothetical protein DNTS_033825 [Danionella translucida]
MLAGELVRVTLRGGGPWGFSLCEIERGDPTPTRLLQIEDGSRAALAGLCEADELVSVNGKACSDLSLPDIIELIEVSDDSLQLLIKRCQPQEAIEVLSTTFRSPSPFRLHDPKEQDKYVSESQDEAYYGETESDGECALVSSQVQIPASKHNEDETETQDGSETNLRIIPGSVVELQLFLSKTTLEVQSAALGSACGVVGDIQHSETEESVIIPISSDCPLYIPRHNRKPLGQRGVLISNPPSLQRPVQVSVEHLFGSGSREEGEKANEGLDSGDVEGGNTEEAPTSSSVSFGLPSEECDSESEREVEKPSKHRARHARVRRSESLSEKQVKEAKSKCKRIALLLSAPATHPNNKGVLMFKKHRQRAKKYTLVSYGTGEDDSDYKDDEEDDDDEEHVVLATSEKEIENDHFTNAPAQKSFVNLDLDTGVIDIKQKFNIQQDMEALPETKGKGALMFAQRKQRMDEIVAEHEELRRKGIPVEAVQETQTHQTYQQMEEHAYMHAQEAQNYMDVNVHNNMVAQKQQQHQQYHQYQDEYYHQQQQQQQHFQEYQQQLQYQQQQYQQHQEYQQQKTYQQMESYNHQQQFQQQKLQQYSNQMNGMQDQQMQNEIQLSSTNRIAKPFSIQNKITVPFSSHTSADNQEQPVYSLGQGEQIASRDERISVPAIKTGILQDTRRKNTNKPMFTFKESPKVSPNPALLNLLNRNDKKAGFESCPEEDYLSLGAEACNFLQSPKMKPKIPPPVAPKPHINHTSPPWSLQQETVDEHVIQPTENIVQANQEVPLTETEPIPGPDMGVPNQQEVTLASEHHDVSHSNEELMPCAPSTGKQPESQMDPNHQSETWNEKLPQPVNSSHPVPPPPDPSTRSWDPAQTQGHQQPQRSTWGTNEVQPQTLSQPQPQWINQSQSPPKVEMQMLSQNSLVAHDQSSPQANRQAQPQSQMSSWQLNPNQSNPQAPWSQPKEPPQPSTSVWQKEPIQSQELPPWTQQQQQQQQQFQGSQLMPQWAPAPQQQPQTPWAHPQRQAQPQPPWVSQPKQQEPTQAPANAWTQSQNDVQAQPPWVQYNQSQPLATAPLQQPVNQWSQMPTHSQPIPPWEPASQQLPPQVLNSWAPEQNQIQSPWAQTMAPTPQVHPPWVTKPQQQPPESKWTPPQSHAHPDVNAWAPQHQQSSVGMPGQMETQKLSPQPVKQWSPSQPTQPSPPLRMNSYSTVKKAPSPKPTNTKMSPSGFGPAFEMPALKGKGAELFAKRQSRMEKYIVDSTTVQANKARPSSPSPSLPNSWKYSPNCRAPPPLSYNPINSPSYPPGAVKQPPASSSSTTNKNKGKEKGKPSPKPLHVLDVMKHQPYQLDSSLFTYGPAAEKLAAEKEAAEKLAAQRAAETQAQIQAQNQQIAYNQSPPPYGFMPQQSQQPYGLTGQSPMHDGMYPQAPPNQYQPALDVYQQHPAQIPYQQEYNPQQAYQQPSLNPYHQAPSPPYQQSSPPSYQAGPNPVYQAGPPMAYRPAPSSYVVPSFPVAPRADSASGSSITAAPKPKFSAKKNVAQGLRSSSLTPPVRHPSAAPNVRSFSSSPSSRQFTQKTKASLKPPSPWEAASRHPLGLVDEAFRFLDLQQSIAANLRYAAQTKLLPEPPAEWKARVAYEPPPKSQNPGQSLKMFLSPTKSTASAPAGPVPYGSLFKQGLSQRSMTEANLGPTNTQDQRSTNKDGGLWRQ